jgi:hypothetical protein
LDTSHCWICGALQWVSNQFSNNLKIFHPIPLSCGFVSTRHMVCTTLVMKRGSLCQDSDSSVYLGASQTNKHAPKTRMNVPVGCWHCPRLHGCWSVGDPEQGDPPQHGAGLVHDLDLVCLPWPQEALQELQSHHWVQLPSGNSGIRMFSSLIDFRFRQCRVPVYFKTEVVKTGALCVCATGAKLHF